MEDFLNFFLMIVGGLISGWATGLALITAACIFISIMGVIKGPQAKTTHAGLALGACIKMSTFLLMAAGAYFLTTYFVERYYFRNDQLYFYIPMAVSATAGFILNSSRVAVYYSLNYETHGR